MENLFRSKNTAIKEVVSAICMLKDREGSTPKDIYFILDNFHGSVPRHVVRQALSSAVVKGLLNRKNNRYKVCRHMNSPFKISRDCRTKLNRRYVPTSGVRVRNFECRMNNRAKSRKSYATRSKPKRSYLSESYRFREVRHPLTCDCMRSVSEDSCETLSSGSSLSEYQRKNNRRQIKKRYPMPKIVVKVEKGLEEDGTPEVPKAPLSCKNELRLDTVEGAEESDEVIRATIRKKIDPDCNKVETKNEAEVIVAVKQQNKCDEIQLISGEIDTISVSSDECKTTAEKPAAPRNTEMSNPPVIKQEFSIPRSTETPCNINRTNQRSVRGEHGYQTRSKTRAEKQKVPSSPSATATKDSQDKILRGNSTKTQGTSCENVFS